MDEAGIYRDSSYDGGRGRRVEFSSVFEKGGRQSTVEKDSRVGWGFCLDVQWGISIRLGLKTLF